LSDSIDQSKTGANYHRLGHDPIDTETANGDTHSTTATIAVTVVPANDTPVARNASYWVQEEVRHGGFRAM
jgi:hypothetical protein